MSIASASHLEPPEPDHRQTRAAAVKLHTLAVNYPEDNYPPERLQDHRYFPLDLSTVVQDGSGTPTAAGAHPNPRSASKLY